MDVGEMQKKLSQWATEHPEERYRDLYSLLCNDTWLRVAHHAVNTNRGRETAGIDGRTMSHFNGDLEGNLGRLQQALRAKTFEPMPVRRVYIPKANGRKRPIGIATIDDRIVQEALRMALEPIWEADFSRHSYGFRPHRSTYDAMTYIGKRLASNGGDKYQWIIEGDLASYFDTIPHRRLIKAVKQRVADRNLRALLWKFLRAGVMYQGQQEATLTGTPQGGIVSPLAANIYLHTFDRYMESNYLNLSQYHRTQRRKQGHGNFLYVRYCDDFVVLCNGTKAEALTMKEELSQVLAQMGLTLSAEKTKVTHITEGFDFLGYRVIRGRGRKGTMVPKVRIPAKAIKTFRHKIRTILAPQRAHESVNAKIAALNRLVRGWCEYYRCTSGPSQVFGRLSHEIYYDMAHWLGRKYQLSIPAVLRRFMRDNTFKTSTQTLIMPSTYTAKRFVAKTWYNPYTEPDKVQSEKARLQRERLFAYDQLWTGQEDRPGGMDLREEMILAKGTTCYLCGTILHPSEVEVDHVTPRARFKDPVEADRMKHLQPICTSCHRAKTQTDLKVLRRMR